MSRLRLIAGPNGSGKSSVFQLIKEFKEKDKVITTGPFVNSDQIEISLKESGFLDLAEFKIDSPSTTLIEDYVKTSALKPPYDPRIIQDLLYVEGSILRMTRPSSSPLIGMIVSDLIRDYLIASDISFTMETVFSHRGKLNLMQKASDGKFKVYLYLFRLRIQQLTLNEFKEELLREAMMFRKTKL